MRILQGKKVLFGLFLSFLLIIVPLGGDAWGDQQETFVGKEVVYTKKVYTLKGYLSKPNKIGSFPAVIYNHGGGVGTKLAVAPEKPARRWPELAMLVSHPCADQQSP